jgi:ubiquinone/menaquinone biosynthesis C-methylase UbiE
MDKAKRTARTYGFLWVEGTEAMAVETWHVNTMQDVIDEPIVRGRRGIEIGSGCGFDSYIMAKNNPSVELISIDMSDGVRRTKSLTAGLGNVKTIQCSALEIPFKDDIFDFAYSFGVLHHTNDPEKGLSEIARVLKRGSPAFLYLYEDHSENPIKYVGIKVVSMLRFLTVRMPPKVLYLLSTLASPVVFLFFTVPAKILARFKLTAPLSGKIPFNFGTTPFSLKGDLYDRFGAPIERRYNREEVRGMFTRNGFADVRVTRLKDTAGWVVWGHKG